MSNTTTDTQSGVGPVFYEIERDGAYLGASHNDLGIYNKTAAYTLAPIQANHFHTVTSGSGVVVTVPNNLPAGFHVRIMQNGAGQVTITAASGTTLLKTALTTKTLSQNAVVTLVVISNTDGVSAKAVLTGDLAAS